MGLAHRRHSINHSHYHYYHQVIRQHKAQPPQAEGSITPQQAAGQKCLRGRKKLQASKAGKISMRSGPLRTCTGRQVQECSTASVSGHQRAFQGDCPQSSLQDHNWLFALRTPVELVLQRPAKPLLKDSNLAWAAGFLKIGFNAPLLLVRWRENKQMLKINDCCARELNGLQPRMAAF